MSAVCSYKPSALYARIVMNGFELLITLNGVQSKYIPNMFGKEENKNVKKFLEKLQRNMELESWRCPGYQIIFTCLGLMFTLGNSCGTAQNEIVSEKFIAQIDFSLQIIKPFTVSPDSKRVTCRAWMDDKWFVVVDGKEEKRYNAIILVWGGRIIFDSPDSTHYLAMIGNNIHLV